MPNLSKLPSGTRIFADANLLAYVFTHDDELARASAAFLARATRQEIEIVTSVLVVSEVIHRVMVAEAIRQHHVTPREAIHFLKAHPDVIKSLREHLTIPSRLRNRYGINILPVTHIELHASRRVRAEYGLMTNDSLVVAVMQRNKLVHLATNDPDFERVREIQVWRLS